MDYYSPQSSRRHNPVDSICRKLQTIQWRGDREPNSPFQIPKLFSSSYDSPQCGLRPNLDGILKRRAFYGDEAESVDRGRMGMPSSAASQKSNLSPFVPLSTPACSPPTPANVTYTVTSTLGETKGADKRDLRQVNTWQRSCSTSSIQSKGAPYFAVTQEPQGKVYVSHIVDYLRHTTSRTPEDTGLEELCYMLDPDQKDVSIDLDTYHAVMREWIDNCRNNGGEECRSMLLNMTSGSLEAFGGEASRPEIETSELVYCVTDLQMSNQKLREEVKKLKQVVESMEEGNQKLAEENEQLRTRARVNQLLAQKEKMLKEEIFAITLQICLLLRVQAKLDSRRADWVVSLDQLAQYTDSLEKELIKMAGNMRRSRTEILHLSVRVQEQENQKRQLCEELEQLKTSQDSRETSCQASAPEEEPGVDLDWEEEIALQDFLKNEVERNCWAQEGQRDCKSEEKSHNVTAKGEGEDGKKWTVVDTAGEEEVRDMSTPLSTVSVEVQLVQNSVKEDQGNAAFAESDPELNSQALQEEAAVPASAHSQAVSIKHPEADALPDRSCSENNTGGEVSETAEFCVSPETTLMPAPGHDQTRTPADPPAAASMVSSSGNSPKPEKTQTQSIQPPCESYSRGNEKDVEADSSAAEMSPHKIQMRDQTADKPAAEDSTSLLPVLVEEEESVPDITADPPTVSVSLTGTNQFTSSGPNAFSERSVAQSGSSIMPNSQSGSGMSNTTSDPICPELSADKTDPSLSKNTKTQDLMRNMEPRAQDETSETSVASRRESETSVISDNEDVFREDRTSLSPSDKEIETEFQRLALGFKCDMFTLEKRLRLEERSRDLAEENVRREVSSCQGLLQALIPLCDDDSQSMEIIQRLQKNLNILIQSMTRVSSRSEMLGAIHQENRIGKAVEVMIQHVENLRRTYTKEHSELLELREALMQSERSFGSEKDGKNSRMPYKQSTRRVSIAAFPRAGGGNMQFDMTKTQDVSEAEAERLTRRSPWSVAGKSMMRPPLKRFVSSAAWVDTEEPSVTMKGSQDELFVMLPSPLSTPPSTDPGPSPSLPHSQTSSRAAAAAVARGGRGIWMWLAMVMMLVGLLALLASLVMQPAVDAAPVGTGDSWVTIQQLLWPYTGLRHNGQPPV
uniref:Lymphoid-restricted membrane protein n=1 Tax=Nothobranchius kadleci TaxID=1051664 RepID=A0A1A8DXN2_NOTKA